MNNSSLYLAELRTVKVGCKFTTFCKRKGYTENGKGLVRYRMDAAMWVWSLTTTYHIDLCTCTSSAARSNFCVYTYNGYGIFFVRSVATKLHACVKSAISACCSFCRTVAERLRQQWHDLASHVVPRALGRGSSLTELQLDANQSSSTKLQHNY